MRELYIRETNEFWLAFHHPWGIPNYTTLSPMLFSFQQLQGANSPCIVRVVMANQLSLSSIISASIGQQSSSKCSQIESPEQLRHQAENHFLLICIHVLGCISLSCSVDVGLAPKIAHPC